MDPYPQRYRTVFSTTFSGFVAAGTGAVRYYIRGNSLYLPASGGGWPTNILPAIATTNMTGYSNLVNGTFYQAWRVLSSRITVQISPEAAVDTCGISVTPSFLATTPATFDDADSQQFTKVKNIAESQPIKDQTVTNAIRTSQFLGVREEAILDDLSLQFYGLVGATPSNQWFWVVNFKPANQVVTINKIPIRVTLQCEAELFADSTADNLETLRRRSQSTLTQQPTSSELLAAYVIQREKECP
jgi:hypothetical protein